MGTRHLKDGSYMNTAKGSDVKIRILMPEIDKRMRRLSKELPKIREKAWRVQISKIYDHMWKCFQAGGGKDHVPAFKEYEQITRDMRAAEGREDGPLGGKLWNKGVFRYTIKQSFLFNKASVKFGWIDGLSGAAVKFQLGSGNKSDPFANSNFRKYLHIKGVSDVPSSYVHNPRDFISSFEDGYVKPNLKQWVDGYVRKTLATQIAREMRKARAA